MQVHLKGAARLHGKLRLSAVKSLYLRLLVNGQHQRVLRRIQIQTEDGRLFLRELRVRTSAAPILDLVGFYLSFVENLMRRTHANAGRLSQFPHTPTVATVGRFTACERDDIQMLLWRDLSRSAPALHILQAGFRRTAFATLNSFVCQDHFSH